MALNFDGINDKVDHGDINAIDGAAALSWMYWTYRPSGAKGPGITKGNLFLVYVADGVDDVACGQSAVWEKTAANTLPADAWTHIAFTYDGGAADPNKIAIYVNGVAQTVTGSNPGATLVSSASVLETGRNTTGFAAGRMGHLKMWTAVLSAAEVVREMRTRRIHRKANLLLWCPYDDGTLAIDYSQNGNNGTVTEATQIQGPPVIYGAGAPPMV